MKSTGFIWVVLLGSFLSSALRSRAGAQEAFAYPVVWPKAGGGTLVAVPALSGAVRVYHLTGRPHGTAYDTPMPAEPESMVDVRGGEPLILRAPDGDPMADEDHFFVLVSNQRLVISIADDERFQFGSPDRIFFMPSVSGSFRGRQFYSQVNGGDALERIKVYNLGGTPSTVELAAWNGTAWETEGTSSVAADALLALDPTRANSPYRVTTSEDAFVVVGYFVDNATAPAVDRATGLTVGSELWGLGSAWHLRAIEPLSYSVDWRGEASSSWMNIASGDLAIDQGIGESVVHGTGIIRITLTGGVGWAITGTPSLLVNTEWNGYFLPSQSPSACLVGRTFFTNSAARTITMLPRAGTTVRISDETTGSLLDTYTSAGHWEFHNFFSPMRAKVEIQGQSAGAVVLVGTLNWGDCDESLHPATCGILEGGYSMPAIAGFNCGGEFSEGTLADCSFEEDVNCVQMVGPAAPPEPVDAGAETGTPRPDASPVDLGFSGPPVVSGRNGSGCSCDLPGGSDDRGPAAAILFAVALALRVRRR